MYEKLIDALSRTLGVEASSLNRESSTESVPGWDSLRQYMILVELEDVFQVKLPIDSFANANNVAKIEEILTLAKAS